MASTNGISRVGNKFLDFPFGIGEDGGIRRTETNDHIRDEIISLLFTAPGERVNLPEFGCGIKNIVFAGNSELLATMVDYVVTQQLSLWLGDKITVSEVNVESVDEKLTIDINYIVKESSNQESIAVTI